MPLAVSQRHHPGHRDRPRCPGPRRRRSSRCRRRPVMAQEDDGRSGCHGARDPRLARRAGGRRPGRRPDRCCKGSPMGRPAATRPSRPKSTGCKSSPRGKPPMPPSSMRRSTRRPVRPICWRSIGLLNEIGGAIYDVDLSEIEPGNARVRLINFSPDAGDDRSAGDRWRRVVRQCRAGRRLGLSRHRAGDLQRGRAR